MVKKIEFLLALARSLSLSAVGVGGGGDVYLARYTLYINELVNKILNVYLPDTLTSQLVIKG